MVEPNYDELRARVEKRYKERQGFLIHLAVFMIINLILWGMWFIVPQAAPEFLAAELDPEEIQFFMLPWPLIVTLGWGIGLVAHFLSYYYQYGAGAAGREAAIRREVEQELARRAYEKPKRDDRLRLTEDGELETILGEDDAEPYRRSYP